MATFKVKKVNNQKVLVIDGEVLIGAWTMILYIK